MIELKDDTNLFVAESIFFPAGQIVDSPVFKIDLAGVWFIQSGQQVEERAFTRAALSDDCRKFSGRYPELCTFENRDFQVGFVEALDDIDGAEDRTCLARSVAGNHLDNRVFGKGSGSVHKAIGLFVAQRFNGVKSGGAK